jgi:endonuclease/exonuclease/phosphatase family metal-dependent hydrolase
MRHRSSLLPRRLIPSVLLACLVLGWFWGGASLAARQRRGPAGSPPAANRDSCHPNETGAPSAAGSSTPSHDAFASAAACNALVASGQRMARAPGSARFVSWNLRWFPDGSPGNEEPGTDVSWVGCVLAWLDADVIAVQEIKQTPKAERALALLLTELGRLGEGRFAARLDDCGSRVPQHVGLVWNEARVRPSELATVAELNPSGLPCEKQWRPGVSGRFVFPGGLDLTVVSAHFKSRADARSLKLREASFAAIPGVFRGAARASADSDWLLLGDLNTMGCEACEPVVTAAEELATASQQLSRAGLRVVPADAAGTEHYRGRSSLLDHALASRAMRELDPRARSHVAGPCGRAAVGGARKRGRPALSDHCPLVLDLSDRDLD